MSHWFDIKLPDAAVRRMSRASYKEYRSYCRYARRVVAARLEERKDDLAKMVGDALTKGTRTFIVQ